MKARPLEYSESQESNEISQANELNQSFEDKVNFLAEAFPILPRNVC
jgi:5'(3')-deoxyribonucleotidase